MHLLRFLRRGEAQGHLPQLRGQFGGAPGPSCDQASERSRLDPPGLQAARLRGLRTLFAFLIRRDTRFAPASIPIWDLPNSKRQAPDRSVGYENARYQGADGYPKNRASEQDAEHAQAQRHALSVL